MINSFVYFIEIENAGICFRPGFRTVRVDIRDLDSVSLLGGGRGWRYIGLFTKGRVEVITNSLYSDRAFDELSGKISEWMGSNGKADRVLTGDNGPGKLGQRSFRRVGAIYYLVAYLALASLATIVLLAF